MQVELNRKPDPELDEVGDENDDDDDDFIDDEDDMGDEPEHEEI